MALILREDFLSIANRLDVELTGFHFSVMTNVKKKKYEAHLIRTQYYLGQDELNGPYNPFCRNSERSEAQKFKMKLIRRRLMGLYDLIFHSPMTKGCINWITCASHAINAKGLENDGWLELDMRNEINRAGDSGSVREHNDSTGN